LQENALGISFLPNDPIVMRCGGSIKAILETGYSMLDKMHTAYIHPESRIKYPVSCQPEER